MRERVPTRAAAVFVLRFLVLFALALGLSIRFYRPLARVSAAWAAILAGTLELVGLGPATAAGAVVTVGTGQRLEIVLECTGLHLAAMWLATVLAFPARWRHRAVGLAVGLVVIPALNLVRLVTAAAVLRWSPHRFGLVHAYGWQTGMVVVLILLAAWWMSGRAATGERPPPGAGPGAP